jgi:hypothetical protein
MADAQDHPAGGIIDAFGGIRPMASKLDVPVSTVQGWKQRDSIPGARMDAIRSAAREHGITLPQTEARPMDSADDKGTGPTIDHEPTPEPTRTASASPARTRSGAAVPLAVLALLAAGGAAGWTWWVTQGPGAAPVVAPAIAPAAAPDLSAIEARIERIAAAQNAAPADPGATARAELEARISALQDAIAARPGSGGEGADAAALRTQLAQLRDEIGALRAMAPDPAADATSDSRLSAIEAELRNAVQLSATNMQAMSGGIVDFQGRLDALDARIAALEKQGTGARSALADSVALALAADQFRRALDTGAPYRNAMTMLAAPAAADPEIGRLAAILEPNADRGIMSRAALAVSFAETVETVLSHAPADVDTIERMVGRLRDVVRVRRVGPSVTGDSPEAIVARAEFLVKDGDIAAALGALSGLEGAAAAAAAPWMERARTLLGAEDALADIEARAFERLRAANPAADAR